MTTSITLSNLRTTVARAVDGISSGCIDVTTAKTKLGSLFCVHDWDQSLGTLQSRIHQVPWGLPASLRASHYRAVLSVLSLVRLEEADDAEAKDPAQRSAFKEYGQ